MRKAIRENPVEIRMGESFQMRECVLLNREIGLFPMWKVLMKHVDLGEPTSFLDRVYLGSCTQRECETCKDIVDNCGNLYPGSLQEEELPSSVKLDTHISSWSYDVESDAKNCVERIHPRQLTQTISIFLRRQLRTR